MKGSAVAYWWGGGCSLVKRMGRQNLPLPLQKRDQSSTFKAKRGWILYLEGENGCFVSTGIKMVFVKKVWKVQKCKITNERAVLCFTYCKPQTKLCVPWRYDPGCTDWCFGTGEHCWNVSCKHYDYHLWNKNTFIVASQANRAYQGKGQNVWLKSVTFDLKMQLDIGGDPKSNYVANHWSPQCQVTLFARKKFFLPLPSGKNYFLI